VVLNLTSRGDIKWKKIGDGKKQKICKQTKE